MPTLEDLELELGEPIMDTWYDDLVAYLAEHCEVCPFDYYGYVTRDLVPNADLAINLGLPVRRFNEVYAGSGTFSNSLTLGGKDVALHNWDDWFVNFIPTGTTWDLGGVGGLALHDEYFMLVQTDGANANSWRRLSALPYGLGKGAEGSMDWDKELYIYVTLTRWGSSATSVSRHGIFVADLSFQLVSRGIAIRIENLSVKLETYGVSRAVVDAGVTMSDYVPRFMVLHHVPATKVELFVDGELKATQIDTSKIPSGSVYDATVGDVDHVNEVANLGTAAQVILYAGEIIVCQKRA